jgi:hypothetical protein
MKFVALKLGDLAGANNVTLEEAWTGAWG